MANNLAIGMVIGASLSSGFHCAFSGAKKKLEQLEQAVAKNQQSHSKLGSELTALRTKQATLYAEMSRASSKGGAGLALMQQEYKKIGKEIANISREQRKWSTELEQSIAKQTKLRNAMIRHTQAKENRDELKGKIIGTVASAAVGVGVMKTYMEQEEAANNLKISMLKADGSFGKFEEIGKIADTLGTDLPGTKKDFYKLAMALKKQGVSDDVLTGGALKTAAELNVLLEMDQESGGEFLAKFMESHRLNEDELPQAADYLQRAMFAGGLSKAQMYESMKYYAPKLNSMKLTGAENTGKVLAIEAMAGQQGLESSTFGTGLNMMLERMNSGPKMLAQAKKGMKAEARDMMKAVGVEFDFWDKKGNFKGIDGMLAEMTKFEKIRAKFGDEGVGLVSKELFGIEGGRLADILAQKGAKGLEEMLIKMREQASLQDRINLKTNTLGAALEALGGAWETFVGDIGSVFAEDIKGFSKGLQSAVEWLVPFVSKHKEAIKFVGGLVGGLVILRGALQAGSFVIQTVTMAMNALKIAAMANPIGLVIGAIAAGAYLIYSHWDSIAPWFANLWANVTAYFQHFCTWVQGIWNGATEWVSNAWTGVSDYFGQLWDGIANFFSSGIGNITATILNWSPLGLFQQVFSTVLSWFGIDMPAKFTDFGKNIIDGLVNGIKNTWESVKQSVLNLGGNITSWFKEKLGIHSPSRVFMGYGDNISQGLAIGIAQTAVEASNAVLAMGQSMQDASPKVLPAPVIKTPKAPKVPKAEAMEAVRLSSPNSQALKELVPTITKNERLQYIQRMQVIDSQPFKPVLNTVETIAKPALNKQKGFFGSLWDDIKFGAKVVGNLLGLNQPSLKTPDFNPNSKSASGQKTSIFSDYEPLNRNAVTQRESSQIPQIVVNFNPTINLIDYGDPKADYDAHFLLVDELDFGTSNYIHQPHTVYGEECLTEEYEPPHECMTDLQYCGNGQLGGLVGTELWLSEPLKPHAFPEAYRYGNFKGTPIRFLCTERAGYILTDSYPVVIEMESPCQSKGCRQISQLEETLPIISYQSACLYNGACFYASKDGLVMLAGNQAKLITTALYTQDQWMALAPWQMIGVVHNGYYFGFTDLVSIRFKVPDSIHEDVTIEQLTTLTIKPKAVCRSNQDELFFATADGIYQWNAGDTWKQFKWVGRLNALPGYTAMTAYKLVQDFAETQVKHTAYKRHRSEMVQEPIILGDKTVIDSRPQRLKAGYATLFFDVEISSTGEVWEYHVATSVAELGVE